MKNLRFLLPVVMLLFTLLGTNKALAVDASYDVSTRTLDIPALRIGSNTNLLHIRLQLGNDGCFAIVTNEPATAAFTGATYDPASFIASFTGVSVGSSLFQATIAFSNGCFRVASLTDITPVNDNNGGVSGQVACPTLNVGGMQTSNVFIEAVSPTFGVLFSDSRVEIITVLSRNGNIVEIEQRDTDDPEVTRIMVDTSGGQLRTIEAFTETSPTTGFITRPTAGSFSFTDCPIPAVGTRSTIETIDSVTNALISSFSFVVSAITPNVSVTTPAGTFTTTRYDFDASPLPAGVASFHTTMFYADNTGAVRIETQTQTNDDTMTTTLQELTSSTL